MLNSKNSEIRCHLGERLRDEMGKKEAQEKLEGPWSFPWGARGTQGGASKEGNVLVVCLTVTLSY